MNANMNLTYFWLSNRSKWSICNEIWTYEKKLWETGMGRHHHCKIQNTKTPSCVVSPRGDHSGCVLVIARRGDTTHSGVDVNNTPLSMINPLNPLASTHYLDPCMDDLVCCWCSWVTCHESYHCISQCHTGCMIMHDLTLVDGISH